MIGKRRARWALTKRKKRVKRRPVAMDCMIQTACAAVFAQEHPCASGPTFGKVVQEGHPTSGIACLRNVHNHAACAFPQDHRWKAIEKQLREVQGIKVQGAPQL